MGKYGTNGIAVIIALNPSGPWTDRQDLDAVGAGVFSFFLTPQVHHNIVNSREREEE
jgi:hypothetical protein